MAFIEKSLYLHTHKKDILYNQGLTGTTSALESSHSTTATSTRIRHARHCAASSTGSLSSQDSRFASACPCRACSSAPSSTHVFKHRSILHWPTPCRELARSRH